MLDLTALDSQELPDEAWEELLIDHENMVIHHHEDYTWCTAGFLDKTYDNLCFLVENHSGPHVGRKNPNVERRIWWDYD